MKLLHAATGEEECILVHGPPPEGGLDYRYVWAVAFSPRGGLLATFGDTRSPRNTPYLDDLPSDARPPAIKLWDLDRHIESVSWIGSQEHGAGDAIAFCPDGSLLAVPSQVDSCVDLVRVKSGLTVLVLGPAVAVRELLKRNGEFQYSGPASWDYGDSTLKQLTISSDGSVLAAGFETSFIVSSEYEGEVVDDWAFSFRARIIETGENIWSVAFRKHRKDYRYQMDSSSATPHWGGLTISADGTLLAAGIDDRVRLWNITAKNELIPLAQSSTVAFVEFSPDGERLLCGCTDGTLTVWNVAPEPAEPHLDASESTGSFRPR